MYLAPHQLFHNAFWASLYNGTREKRKNERRGAGESGGLRLTIETDLNSAMKNVFEMTSPFL